MALTSTEEALIRQILDQQAAILSLAGNEATITSKLGATKVNLSGLLAASGINSADLLLIRQGTTDKSTAVGILREFLLDPITTDGLNNRVGVNNLVPEVTLDILATDAIRVPVGSGVQRPSTGLAAEDAGLIRFNTDVAKFEGHNGITWGTLSGDATDYKDSVRFTTTSNIVLSGLGTRAGGDWPAALTAADRILVKNNTLPAENGLYTAAAGAWVRATDADTGAELNSGAIVPVESGTLNTDSNWQLTTDGAVVVGTTALTFVQFGSVADLSITTSKLANLAVTRGKLAADAVGIYSNGLAAYTITSTLNAADFGRHIHCNNAGAITLTLPAIGASPVGSIISIANTNDGVVTIARAGTALILSQVSTGATSVNLNRGESIQLLTDGTNWIQVASGNRFGAGQTWQDFTVSRAAATNYTNTSGNTIVVSIRGTIAANGTGTITVGGVILGYGANQFGDRTMALTLTAAVPNGGIYSMTGITPVVWAEWRV